MKKLLIVSLLLSVLLPAVPARADVPGLQVVPLQYEDTLTTNTVRQGYIEVSNPSDATISLESNVQGFRQIDNQGHLTFFDNPDISAGIQVDLPKFDLGPHEAIRVAFSVDPTKLPKGGVYAVIFFRTIPPPQSANSSFVAESANIGTLLLLQNGPAGVHRGQISSLSLPFLQLGNGISGTLDYRNTDTSPAAVGFSPKLVARVFPWGAAPHIATGLVLPSSVRRFAVTRTGSFLGLLPVTITDSETHAHSTRWVFALTGWYQLLLLIIVFGAVCMWAARRLPRPKIRVWSTKTLIWIQKRLSRRRPAPVKRSMDTISRKPVGLPVAEPTIKSAVEPEPIIDAVLDPTPEIEPEEPTSNATLESNIKSEPAKLTPKTPAKPKSKRQRKPKTKPKSS